MKTHLHSIILVLFAVIFLIPSLMLLMKGEPLSFSPAVAVAIGALLGAVGNAIMKRKSGGS